MRNLLLLETPFNEIKPSTHSHTQQNIQERENVEKQSFVYSFSPCERKHIHLLFFPYHSGWAPKDLIKSKSKLF